MGAYKVFEHADRECKVVYLAVCLGRPIGPENGGWAFSREGLTVAWRKLWHLS